MSNPPSTYSALRQFYIEQYRPLYDRFIVQGAIAQELHSEVAAAADHLLCTATTSLGDIPPQCCERVAGHLKRATFDGFKLIFEKDIRTPYEKLMDVKYADVHDGKLYGEISEKWNQAFSIAMQARSLESLSRSIDLDSWNMAFDEWRKILPIADYFSELIASESVVRVAKNNRRQRFIFLFGKIVEILISAFVGAFVGALITWYLASWIK